MVVVLVILLFASLFGVVKGADYFLEAAKKVGHHLGLPSFVVGVVLVGFGTSLPELATSVSSIVAGQHNVTLANIIGSNMANILLIVGLSTLLLGSLIYKKKIIHLDLPYLLGVTALFAILIIDGQLSWSDSLFLLVSFVFYIFYTCVDAKKSIQDQNLLGVIKGSFGGKDKSRQLKRAAGLTKKELFYQIAVALLAVVLLGLASRIAVLSMLEIAAIIQVGISVITFLTLALGTSLPELLVSFKTLKSGQSDLFLGNIIGSSIFNILLIGGITGLLHTQFLDADLIPWSITGLAVASIVFVVAGITQKIDIWQGSLFVVLYLALITQIVT